MYSPSEIFGQRNEALHQAAVRVGFACFYFSPTFISEPDVLILNSFLIQKEKDICSKESQLICKGAAKTGLVNHPVEVPVCP